MRRIALYVAIAFGASLMVGAEARAESDMLLPVAEAPGKDNLAGHVLAIGVGVAAGVVVASVALPATWGWAGTAVGAIVGGTAGNLAYARAIEKPLLQRAKAKGAEVPSLFHLATR